MKVLHEVQDELPIAYFQLASVVGSTWDPAEKDGLVCHAAELSMRGTTAKSREEFDRELDRLGASLGFVVGRDGCALHGSCLARNLEELVSLASESIAQAAMRDDEHEQLIRESCRSIEEMRDDDMSLASRAFTLYWPYAPYARSTLGRRECLEGLRPQDAHDAHRAIFHPAESELILGLAGDFTEKRSEEISSRFQAALAQLGKPSPALVAPHPPPCEETPQTRILVDKPDRHQCQVLVGMRTPEYTHADYDALSVADCALGGIFCSRLVQEIRVDKGWSYDVGSNLRASRHPHYLQIQFSPSHENLQASLAHIEDMLTRLRGGLDEDEFSFVRSHLRGAESFAWATANQRLRHRISDLQLGLPEGHSRGYRDRLAALSNSDVNTAIEEHLSRPPALVLVLGSQDSMDRDFVEEYFDHVIDYLDL